MKKQRKKPTPTAKSAHAKTAHPARKKPLTRREVLTYAKTGALATVILGGGGFFMARSVGASISEQDLSKIGNGTPAIVQIHDPGCALCLALQREARQSLKTFDRDALTYLVANIKTPKGRDFANRYGVPHVTLILFDGQGEVHDILNGSYQSDTLTRAFSALLEAS